MLDDNVYYVHELFLDPPELNFTALQKVVNGNKNTWQSDPKKDRIGKAFLALTAPPAPPAETLPNLADEARKSRLKELNKQIDIDQADEVLTEEEYDKTVKKFSKYFTEKTIKSCYRLTVYHFPIPKEPAKITAGIKQTDKTKMKELDTLLDEIRAVVNEEQTNGKTDVLEEKFGVTKRVENIYDILGVRDTVGIIALQKAIEDAINAVTSIMSNKRGSALYKFFGKFKGGTGLFADDKAKQGYDLALKLKSFNVLVESEFIRIAINNNGGRISSGEYEHSLKRAREEKCWEAEWCVYNYYINEKKLKPPVEPIKDDRTLQCFACGTYNKSNAERCTICGTPLKIECPKCRRVETSGAKVCSQCGFDFGDIIKAQDALKEAKVALASGDVAGAEKFMRQVNTYWRECPSAAEVKKNIDEAKKELAKVQEQINDIEKKVRTALGKCELYEVQRLILDLRRIPQAKGYLVSEEKDVEKHLTDVRTKLAQLPAIADIAKKIDICEEIIAIAADCREAQDALAKYPPMPPSNLSAKVNTAGSVDLAWTSPASRKPPMFVVVRKTGGVPASPTDGQTVTDNLANTTFTDSTCEIGVIYGYAVFTKRDKVCDQNGCRLQQPVQRIGELEDIKVLPADKGVTFSWAKPANCIGIQITRYKSGSTQGTKLPLQQEMGLTDSGLINDTDYIYLFQSVFHTAEKKTVETAGVKRTVKPQLPPPAVQDLTADTADGLAGFQWTPPSRGEVLLFNLASEPDIQPGQTEADTPLKLKEKYGEPLPILNPKQGQTSWKNTTTGVRYIVPFTVHNGLATIGKSVSLMRIQDVVNLRAQISGPRLFVSWDWQEGQDTVLFVYRNDKQPDGVNDSSATKKIVSRQDYDREKAVVLSADNTQDFYIKVYSVVQHNGKKVYSVGVSAQTAVSEIHWKFIVHRACYLFGTIIDAKILIERRNGKGIPDLVVRKDFNRKPLGRSFGTVVMEIARSLERSVTVDFDDEQFADNARFQVFTKNESEAGRYALYGQNDETMKYVCSQRTFKDFIVELLYHPIRSLMQINTQIQQDFLNKK